jgi:glycosyltransferase involved in cell wall biosynthesis
MKELSVIIPTYNRKDILMKCLHALFQQICSKSDFEIIVIDDGSTDQTESIVKGIVEEAPVTLKYIKQKNRGPAAARNTGIKNAQGKIVLFIGDDIIATQSLLEEHLNWHRNYTDKNVAVLGYVTWSPELQCTPFMGWLENGGPQFTFWKIKDWKKVDAREYFYTSNISLKRAFLLENNGYFDEEFPYAAYEDIELGFRLKRKGMILKYNRSAIAYHYHYTSLKNACRRMIYLGESEKILGKKIGKEQKLFPKSLFRKVLSKPKFLVCYLIATYFEKRAISANIFEYIMDYYQLVGNERYRNKKERERNRRSIKKKAG